MKPVQVIRIAVLGLGIGGACPALAGISTSPSVRGDIIPIRMQLVYDEENSASQQMALLGQRDRRKAAKLQPEQKTLRWWTCPNSTMLVERCCPYFAKAILFLR